MPNYKQKLTNPLIESEFIQAMKDGNFVKIPQHQGLVAFVYYTGVRISEALAMTRQQFHMTPTELFCDIGPRRKKRKVFSTDPLPIPLELPYVDTIEDCLLGLKPEMKVWPYSRTTGWLIFRRAGLHYPHYGRLSAVTNFLLEGYTTPEIKSWFGITATAIDYYTGKVAILKMGKALQKRHRVSSTKPPA